MSNPEFVPAPGHILGSQLTPDDQKYVLKANVSRFTLQRKPKWADAPREDGQPHAPQFIDDEDWLAHCEFRVDENNRIVRGRWSMINHPTYPKGVVEKPEDEPKATGEAPPPAYYDKAVDPPPQIPAGEPRKTVEEPPFVW